MAKINIRSSRVKFTIDTITCNVSSPIIINTIFDKLTELYSNFNQIIRQLAWCIRFINNIKAKLINKNSNNISVNYHVNLNKNLTTQELIKSNPFLVKWIQDRHFKSDLLKLKDNLSINKTSKLISLNSFLDENGILREVGRISNAAVAYDIKHPIILPSSDPIITILVRTTHEQHLHAGPTLLLSILRQKYWILRCKNACNVPCHRQKQTAIQPMMADLPVSRVTLVRPFITTGVDYAGPLYIRSSKRRGSKLEKAYVVVLVN